MQREIVKRAEMYGIAAVLLAIMLGTLCYNLGVIPPKSQDSTPPSTPSPEPSSEFLKTFASYQELLSFLKANSKTQGVFPFYRSSDLIFTMGATTLLEGAEYSTTNVQVAGVDEADIVKTDGKYIYVIANNSVFILEAYPPEEAKVLSKITFSNDTYLAGIFISFDGSKLAVLGGRYSFYIQGYSYYRYYYADKTFIYIYDTSNKTSPVFKRDFTMSGSYFGSRMIGEYIYAVISQPVYVIYDTVILPKIYSKDGMREIEASKIYYSNTSEDYYMFTTVVALNILNDDEEVNTLTLMMGGTSNLYVSLNNIYITFHSFDWQTTVYRIRIENRTMNWEAKGTVQGREPSQFSMDEYNDYFRITVARWADGIRQNDLYILDMNLTIVGNLTGIAPGENLDSTRFIGNRCYLTTSIQRKDPFFVIDVENPRDPKFLGKLDIPGFTRYLHPYDENHLIGVGADANNNVQILTFDISNVSNPIAISNFTVPRMSSTPVLWEHKAFLFSKAKELLVIPVFIYIYPWQGVYVFNTTNCGLALKGNITHVEDGVSAWNSAYQIKRALYIEDMLYTVSDKKLKINRIEDLLLKGEIVFP